MVPFGNQTISSQMSLRYVTFLGPLCLSSYMVLQQHMQNMSRVCWGQRFTVRADVGLTFDLLEFHNDMHVGCCSLGMGSMHASYAMITPVDARCPHDP